MTSVNFRQFMEVKQHHKMETATQILRSIIYCLRIQLGRIKATLTSVFLGTCQFLMVMHHHCKRSLKHQWANSTGKVNCVHTDWYTGTWHSSKNKWKHNNVMLQMNIQQWCTIVARGPHDTVFKSPPTRAMQNIIIITDEKQQRSLHCYTADRNVRLWLVQIASCGVR